MSAEGRSTGTGLFQAGVFTRTAATKIWPAVTAAGRSRRTVW